MTPQESIRRLQVLMDSRNMTVAQLAILLEMSPKTVEPWFRSGKSHYLPSIATVPKLLRVLDLEGEEPPPTNLDLFGDRTDSSESNGDPEVQSMVIDNKYRNSPTTADHSSDRAMTLLEDTQRFQDEVYGEILLNTLERDVVDSPEFQRLFRISQLGFIDLVYQCANHTRGQHSIGVCESSKRLINRLNKNSVPSAMNLQKQLDRFGDSKRPKLPPLISPAEEVLIRLGALVHDIPHGPFSHDIEKKMHYVYNSNTEETPMKSTSHYGAYSQHDDLRVNPSFYLAVYDSDRSVLARVLKHYSPVFWALLRDNAQNPNYQDHLAPFIKSIERSQWVQVEDEILQALLFHLMAFEKLADGRTEFCLMVADKWLEDDTPHMTKWGLGPEHAWKDLHSKWYQPYRHDIIGNTLSADLVDYLQRDLRRLGIDRGMDLTLLNSYVLAPIEETLQVDLEPSSSEPGGTLFRCAIDLNDYKRGTIRDSLLNDVFRLLDLRYEIHEKAVNHRVVHSAVAMLSRSLLQLGKADQKPPLREIVGTENDCPANFGEESFLKCLMDRMPGEPGSMEKVNSLPQKIAERRIYRPLMIIPGDVAINKMLRLERREIYEFEIDLRKLAAIVDSQLFSPFFLFLSSVVETYLQHGFAEDADVQKYIERFASSDCSKVAVDQAMNLVPKRVIVSASPYKQLYKDPALVIRADDKVMQIDDLRFYPLRPELAARVKASMGDAEQKYAGMWKLFVFISDGLYYSGTLAKLIPNHRCGTKVEAHLECLSFSQRILIASFKTAYEYWKEKSNVIAPRTLDSALHATEFQQLLRILLAKTREDMELYPGIQDEVSGIDLEWYLHGDDLEKCKDVRYKFDQPVSSKWEEIASESGGGSPESTRALMLFGISEQRLMKREAQEFLERYQSAPEIVKETIRSEIEQAEKEILEIAARNPLPSPTLIEATRELYNVLPDMGPE